MRFCISIFYYLCILILFESCEFEFKVLYFSFFKQVNTGPRAPKHVNEPHPVREQQS